jgi:hypothetical protein
VLPLGCLVSFGGSGLQLDAYVASRGFSDGLDLVFCCFFLIRLEFVNLGRFHDVGSQAGLLRFVRV